MFTYDRDNPEWWRSSQITRLLQEKLSSRHIYGFALDKMSDTTLVTAYYKIPSKYPHTEYDKWMASFLSLPTAMVIYTDEQSENEIRNLRCKLHGHADLTHIIVRPLMASLIYQEFYSYFKYCETIDSEHCHNASLYTIWNAKAQWVHEAVTMNIFNSRWFIWCDIGCCRNGIGEMKPLLTFPNIQTIESKLNLPNNKLCLFAINAFSAEEKRESERIIQKAQGRHESLDLPAVLRKPARDYFRIQGGIMLGTARSWERWTLLYYKQLRRFKQNGWFGGKDQYVMNALALWYPNDVHVVAVPGSDWFWFRHYLK